MESSQKALQHPLHLLVEGVKKLKGYKVQNEGAYAFRCAEQDLIRWYEPLRDSILPGLAVNWEVDPETGAAFRVNVRLEGEGFVYDTPIERLMDTQALRWYGWGLEGKLIKYKEKYNYNPKTGKGNWSFTAQNVLSPFNDQDNKPMTCGTAKTEAALNAGLDVARGNVLVNMDEGTWELSFHSRVEVFEVEKTIRDRFNNIVGKETWYKARKVLMMRAVGLQDWVRHANGVCVFSRDMTEETLEWPTPEKAMGMGQFLPDFAGWNLPGARTYYMYKHAKDYAGSLMREERNERNCVINGQWNAYDYCRVKHEELKSNGAKTVELNYKSRMFGVAEWFKSQYPEDKLPTLTKK